MRKAPIEKPVIPPVCSANQDSRACRALVPLLLRWFDQNARDLPWRRTRDPYAIWVSEVMLQQTQVKTVLPYWERWMEDLPDVRSLANARSERVHKLWEGLGYYTRARNMQHAARMITGERNGVFPSTYEEVLRLPGIGPYTAGAICSIAFDQPTPILDGNVIRVLARVFGVEGNPREGPPNARLWRLARKLVTSAKSRAFEPYGPLRCSRLNQSLMELGALVCRVKEPACLECPLRGRCQALREGRTGELPQVAKRVPTQPRHFVAFLLRQNGRFLIRQRPGGVVNGQLWEFPGFELQSREPGRKSSPRHLPGIPVARTPSDAARRLFNQTPTELTHVLTLKHTITRFRITLDVWHAELNEKKMSLAANEKWAGSSQLSRLPFPSAHRKIIRWLLRQAEPSGNGK